MFISPNGPQKKSNKEIAMDKAKELDRLDGKEDGFINFKTWNNYAGDRLNHIEKYIPVERAAASIESYLNGTYKKKDVKTGSTSKTGGTKEADIRAYAKSNHITISSRANISGLNSRTQQKLLEAMQWAVAHGYTLSVNSAYRTEQQQLAQNPAVADTVGHSQHVKGNAFDMTLMKNGKAVTTISVYKQLAKALGIWNGRDFPDRPMGANDKEIFDEAWHFQTVKGDGYLFDPNGPHHKKTKKKK